MNLMGSMTKLYTHVSLGVAYLSHLQESSPTSTWHQHKEVEHRRSRPTAPKGTRLAGPEDTCGVLSTAGLGCHNAGQIAERRCLERGEDSTNHPIHYEQALAQSGWLQTSKSHWHPALKVHDILAKIAIVSGKNKFMI